MRLVSTLIRTIMVLIAVVFGAIVFLTVMVVGGVFMLLSGKRPKVQIFKQAGWPPRQNFEPNPPMKDVTPIHQDQIKDR